MRRKMKNRNIQIITTILALFPILLTLQCGKKIQPPQKKQIILISIDTLRGDHLEAYGYSRETAPNLARLVDDSVYYKNAYPNGCWTMPSHTSMLTGTLPSRHGINLDWKSLKQGMYPSANEKIENLSEILQKKGIETVKYADLPDELGFNRGFDRNYNTDPFFRNRKFNKLLKDLEKSKDREFFFFIHTWMVHAPYANSRYMEEKQLNSDLRYKIDNFRKLPKKSKFLTRDFHAFLKENQLLSLGNCINLYDGGIHFADNRFGQLIEALKKSGIYDNVMLIVTSDHGEHFDEHYSNRYYDHHGKDFYEEFIKVPLLIKYPSGRSKIKKEPVSLIDIVPTVLDYYGLPIPGYIQGQSLHAPGEDRARQYFVSEAISLGHMERKMIRVGDLKYIVTMDNPSNKERTNWQAVTERRLFDLAKDPGEKNNLFLDPKFKQIAIDFEKLLRSIIKESAAGHNLSGKKKIGKETLEKMESLGYL